MTRGKNGGVVVYCLDSWSMKLLCTALEFAISKTISVEKNSTCSPVSLFTYRLIHLPVGSPISFFFLLGLSLYCAEQTSSTNLKYFLRCTCIRSAFKCSCFLNRRRAFKESEIEELVCSCSHVCEHLLQDTWILKCIFCAGCILFVLSPL